MSELLCKQKELETAQQKATEDYKRKMQELETETAKVEFQIKTLPNLTNKAYLDLFDKLYASGYFNNGLKSRQRNNNLLVFARNYTRYLKKLSDFISLWINENRENELHIRHLEIQDNAYGGDLSQYFTDVKNGFETTYHPNLFSIQWKNTMTSEDFENFLIFIEQYKDLEISDDNLVLGEDGYFSLQEDPYSDVEYPADVKAFFAAIQRG